MTSKSSIKNGSSILDFFVRSHKAGRARSPSKYPSGAPSSQETSRISKRPRQNECSVQHKNPAGLESDGNSVSREAPLVIHDDDHSVDGCVEDLGHAQRRIMTTYDDADETIGVVCAHKFEHEHLASSVKSDCSVRSVLGEDASVVASIKRVGELAELIHPSWQPILNRELVQPYFTRLQTFLINEEKQGKTVYPPKRLIFNSLASCTFERLKVVIIGQDPYHGPGQAHGLAFSVQVGITPPPSLKNILKEAMEDVNIRKPADGNLDKWSRQGVLLLNTVLTVRRGEPNSHKNKGWEQFTDAIIRAISEKTSGKVFLLWGKPAQEKAALINLKKHHVIKSSHPSPLGAAKTAQPFLGSRSFSRANAYLTEQGLEPIDWNL